MTDGKNQNLPSVDEKPSLLDWLEQHFGLPFRLPRIPFAQLAKNLDKAAGAIVVAGGQNIVARIQTSTTRIEAKSSAEKRLIEFGQEQISSGAPGLSDRALQYAIGDAIAKQTNREEILRIASEQLSSDPPKSDAPAEIDDDWLNIFNRYSETKTNSDIQQLWARILSSEIRKPGTTSLRTLDFLSTVNLADATRIVRMFSFVVDGAFVPQWAHENKRCTFGELFSLQEIGILSGIYGIGGPSINKSASVTSGRLGKAVVVLTYFDMVAMFDTDNEDFRLSFSTAVLSEVGRNLFQITDTKMPDYAFFEEFVTQLGAAPIKQISIARAFPAAVGRIIPVNERVVYPKQSA